MRCPSCGSKNAAGAKFCSECAARLAPAAQARLWVGEWLVQQGLQAEGNVLLECALVFWRSVGAECYVRGSESLLADAS